MKPVETGGVVGSEVDRAMDRYANGDAAAFGAVYDALAPRLWAYLRRRLSSESEARDVLQQCFLNMHRARGSFTPGAAVTPWAYAIARRLLLDTFRRHKRKPESSLPDDEFLAPSAGDPERAALSQERIRALGESLKRLPETYRTAFELVRLEGLSMAEAAEILGVTKTAVKLRAHRAYVALGLSDEEPI